MNDQSRTYSLASLLIILTGLIGPFICGAGPPPASGDWIIDDTTTIDTQAIVLNGNLVVEAGGSLTLNSVTLELNVSADGEFGITVDPGGNPEDRGDDDDNGGGGMGFISLLCFSD